MEISSKRQLAVLLSQLESFVPDVSLEQYPSDSEIAADALWKCAMLGTINGKSVIDLGCGSGILGIGALLLGAKEVIFVDLDKAMIEATFRNLALLSENALEFRNYRLVEGDVSSLKLPPVDTVIMNPPFGTRQKGADIMFVEKACAVSDFVMSMHKTSTKNYVMRFFEKQGFSVSVEDHQFPLKQTLKQHTRRIHRIEVSVFFAKRKGSVQ